MQMFRVKILDFKYIADYAHLNFQYQIYEIEAKHEKQAVKIARENYMKGQKPMFYEELPFILKLYSVDKTS